MMLAFNDVISVIAKLMGEFCNSFKFHIGYRIPVKRLTARRAIGV